MAGELCKATPFTEPSSAGARREFMYYAGLEEAEQDAFLFLGAPLNSRQRMQRQCEIRNFRELYPGASQCSGNIGQEVMVYNKNELLGQVTSFIKVHREKRRIVILFVGSGDEAGQIFLEGEHCSPKEYIDSVDAVAKNLHPAVPIDLINAQSYAHLLPRAQSPFVKITNFTNIDRPHTHSFCFIELADTFLNWQIIELQEYGRTERYKQYIAVPLSIEETPQPTERGFALALFPDTIDERFKCETCKLVMRDAVQAPCGHRHCKTCLDDFIRSSDGRRCSACPEGAEGGEIQIFPDDGVRYEIYTLRVVCDQGGCVWTGYLRNYQKNHERSCP